MSTPPTPPPQAYPLQWPAGWRRSTCRGNSKFKTTLANALDELNKQVRLMGGTDLIISSNVSLGQSNATDPGVVAYFMRKKRRVAIPCDQWYSVRENVMAIARTIECMRGIERYGTGDMVDAAFTGFQALMPPGENTSRTCWDILGIPITSSRTAIDAAYKSRARACHPDHGGSNDAMAELNTARDQALLQATSA